jgi:hypothetical protein
MIDQFFMAEEGPDRDWSDSDFNMLLDEDRDALIIDDS